MAVKVGYVPTAEQVAAQQARRAAQAAEKAARFLQVFCIFSQNHTPVSFFDRTILCRSSENYAF